MKLPKLIRKLITPRPRKPFSGFTGTAPDGRTIEIRIHNPEDPESP